MSALILIVGKQLCSGQLGTVLADMNLGDYMCVDNADNADWLMRDGYSCDVLIVDRGAFGSLDARDEWIAANPQAVSIVTDDFQTHSATFRTQLKDAVGLSHTITAQTSQMGAH